MRKFLLLIAEPRRLRLGRRETSMRKHLVWLAGLATIFAASGIALAAGGTTQKISGKATPSKLPEKGRVGVSVKFSETTGTTNPDGVQPLTREAKIFLDKDFSLNTKGLPKCRVDAIIDKSTAEAKAACADSQVGVGSAVARIADGSGFGHIDIPAVVTAFNGKPGSAVGLPSLGGKPIMILHIVIGASAAVDVPLSITKVPGAYGTELATFPGADAQPIRNLTLTLYRSFTAHGKHKDYVSARCSHGQLLYKGRFAYVGSPSLTATSSQRCTVRQ